MGANKETLTADGLCHRQILGAPLKNGTRHVRTIPTERPKNLSQKGFCGAFSLKKRPSAPQRPPRPQARRHHQYKGISKPSGIIPPKDKWVQTKKRSPLTVFAIGKYWARHSKMGPAMFALSPRGTQKTFPKKVFAELFP